MKIIKLTKPENASQQLKNLEEGDSMRQDFEITLEDNPEQKYLVKLLLQKSQTKSREKANGNLLLRS